MCHHDDMSSMTRGEVERSMLDRRGRIRKSIDRNRPRQSRQTKRSAPAFQIGAAQDQQTKSAEPVRWRISASKVTVRTVWIVRTEVVSSHCNIYHMYKDTVYWLIGP